MDLGEFKSTLDTYGRDNLVVIIFDNSRVWLIKRPKPSDDPALARRGYALRDENNKIMYTTFDEMVEIDEGNSSLVYIEHQHGVDYETSQKIRWKIVNHVENIQGLLFLPDDATDAEKQMILDYWDHTLT